jgi:hypothetical protein
VGGGNDKQRGFNPNTEVGNENLQNTLIGNWLGMRLRGKIAHSDCRRGAHGVTRPTNDGLATCLFDFIAHFGVRV